MVDKKKKKQHFASEKNVATEEREVMAQNFIVKQTM